MNTSEFQIGDLVTWKDESHMNMRERFITGIVMGSKPFPGWDLDYPVETEAIVVHWNGNVITNTSPFVLRKL